MKKLAFHLMFSLFIFSITPIFQRVWAAGEFRADYDVDYTVSPAGVTIVTQNITLTNLQTNVYPKQYAIVIDTDKIGNVIARDSRGLITPQIKQEDGKTEINLAFNDQVVGLGKKLNFTLRYENLVSAQKLGNIWELNIPGVADNPDIGQYSVRLDVPTSFGPNAYMSPPPADGFRWNKKQMLQGGISAGYGILQTFAVDLSYDLINPKVTPVSTTIALPPDTAFQKVYIRSLKPAPLTVNRDTDGNWIARYDLFAGQRQTITAQTIIAVQMKPRPDFQTEAISANDYLRPLSYWETTNPLIQQLAKTYRTPRSIYQYVTTALRYDYQRVNQRPVRKGAVEALANPEQAICMEFTDVFVAIARAAGIPAREVIGYAYTTNSKLRPLSLVSDILHSWPEYYDQEKKLWVPVDPTWGNTTGGINYFDKLDFNHLVFAIHGQSSDFPLPVGFYRSENKIGKDISVVFSQEAPPAYNQKLKTTFEFPTSITAGFPANGFMSVENISGQNINSLQVLIQSTPFPFVFRQLERNLPPYWNTRYPIRIDLPNYLSNTEGHLTATVNSEIVHHYFKIRPMYRLFLAAFLFIAALSLFLLLIFKRKLWKRS